MCKFKYIFVYVMIITFLQAQGLKLLRLSHIRRFILITEHPRGIYKQLVETILNILKKLHIIYRSFSYIRFLFLSISLQCVSSYRFHDLSAYCLFSSLFFILLLSPSFNFFFFLFSDCLSYFSLSYRAFGPSSQWTT